MNLEILIRTWLLCTRQLFRSSFLVVAPQTVRKDTDQNVRSKAERTGKLVGDGIGIEAASDQEGAIWKSLVFQEHNH